MKLEIEQTVWQFRRTDGIDGRWKMVQIEMEDGRWKKTEAHFI
jgi:hypothetical protein